MYILREYNCLFKLFGFRMLLGGTSWKQFFLYSKKSVNDFCYPRVSSEILRTS